MFVMFDHDEVIFPRESQIFGSLTKKDSEGKRQVIKMEDSDIYKNDSLGLKALDSAGKLKIVHIDGKHTRYSLQDIS